jgi:hypothetical protein
MSKIKQQLWEKLEDDIAELTKPLQLLLNKGFKTGSVNEEDIISEIDDMDLSSKLLEKFYDLADKLSIKILTIEEILEQEAQALVEKSKL